MGISEIKGEVASEIKARSGVRGGGHGSISEAVIVSEIPKDPEIESVQMPSPVHSLSCFHRLL